MGCSESSADAIPAALRQQNAQNRTDDGDGR